LKKNCILYVKIKTSSWPKMFKRFIDDGFGVIKSNKKNFCNGLMNSITFAKIFS